jgi:hypothetical protein
MHGEDPLTQAMRDERDRKQHRALGDVGMVVVDLLDDETGTERLVRECPPPRPCTATATWKSWVWNPSKEPKRSSIGAASSPSGQPPPSGERFFQNVERGTWPEMLNARVFSKPTSPA